MTAAQNRLIFREMLEIWKNSSAVYTEREQWQRNRSQVCLDVDVLLLTGKKMKLSDGTSLLSDWYGRSVDVPALITVTLEVEDAIERHIETVIDS